MENVFKLNNLYTEVIRATELAKEHYLRTQKFIPTMICWSRDSDEICFLLLPEIGDRETGGRANSIKTARIFNAIFGTRMYVIITEAWFLQTASDENHEKYAGRVSEHPDKMECLMILACEKGRTLGTILKIKEDRTLEDHMQLDSMGGEFAELQDWDFRIGDSDTRKQLLDNFYKLGQVFDLKGKQDDQSTTREQ